MSNSREWAERITRAAKLAAPNLLSNIPGVGEAAKDLLNAFDYDRKVAEGCYETLLKKLSSMVESKFIEDGIGLEGGLIYGKTGNGKSNFLVSRSVAAWLNSITDPDVQPLSLKNIVLALLHERTWQSKDSHELYARYVALPLYEGVTEITSRLAMLVQLATNIRNITIAAIADFEPAAEMFKRCNGNVSIVDYMEYAKKVDQFNGIDQADLFALSTSPTKLIERYMEIFSVEGAHKFHFISYPIPVVAPDKQRPPMLQQSMVKGNGSVSPGLAIGNIVRIRPYKFLAIDAANQDDLHWPYGREPKSGYINIHPPFELWTDLGGDVTPPEWLEEDRLPDVVSVSQRQYDPNPEQWDEYVKTSSTTLE